MRSRRFVLALAVVAALGAGVGVGALPASAQKRTLVVTLLGGKTVVVTVDAPATTPADQIKLPDLGAPVIGVSEPGAGTSTTPTTGTTTTPSQSSGNDGTLPQKPRKQSQPQPPTQSSKPVKQTPKAQPEGKTHRKAARKEKKKQPKPSHAHAQPITGPGVPTPANPTFTFAEPGPAPIGVPNFLIDQFRVPPFLLPIYQAAGIQYDIPWQVLAAINEIETDYGRNLSVSTAGAVGWMQFMPSTWKSWGVDANGDKVKDPYNPVDAIFAAARYLRAAGGSKHLRQAIFAYNHADWYVESVLLRAKLLGGLPAGLVGSLTGLTQGHFPVAAKAVYADQIDVKQATRRVQGGGNVAQPVQSEQRRKGIDIFSHSGAPVIAVQDGRILKLGVSDKLGNYVVLQDVYGNRYTYGHLGKLSTWYAVPKLRRESAAQIRRELKLPKPDPKPTQPATAGVQPRKAPLPAKRSAPAPAAASPATASVSKERLFAHPARPFAYRHGGRHQLVARPHFTTFKDYFTVALGLKRKDVVLKRLKPGSQVIAGTILGRIGRVSPTVAPHVYFEIRPAGRGAPRIDPKPILDGWKLLEATAIYRASGKNPFFGPDARNPSIGQILLMSKEQLEQRVLADPHIKLYSCGRRDIQAGVIDRRVLATLEYLVASGLDPTVTSLKCGHSFLTASGNVSEHSSGDAVDIAAVNDIPIAGHQGAGSITDITIRRLLVLQGTMKPHQIISLMTYRGADNTLSLPDHWNHIHVGFRPMFGANTKLGKQIAAILKPGQWLKLVDRLNAIPEPKVLVKPSRYSIKVHRGGD